MPTKVASKVLKKQAKYSFNGSSALYDTLYSRVFPELTAKFNQEVGESPKGSERAAYAKLIDEINKTQKDPKIVAAIVDKAAELANQQLMDYDEMGGAGAFRPEVAGLTTSIAKDLIKQIKDKPQKAIGASKYGEDFLKAAKKLVINRLKRGLSPAGLAYKEKPIEESKLLAAYKKITGKDYEKPGFWTNLFMDTKEYKDLPTALYYQYDPHYNTEKFSPEQLTWLAEQAGGQYFPGDKGSDAYYVDPE